MAVDKSTSTDSPKKDEEMQYLKELINLQFDKLELKTKMIAPILKKRTENYITSYISSLKAKSDFPLVLLRDALTQTDAPNPETKALKDAHTETDPTYYQIIGGRSILKSMIPIPILGASLPPKWTPNPKVKEILELKGMNVKKDLGAQEIPGLPVMRQGNQQRTPDEPKKGI